LVHRERVQNNGSINKVSRNFDPRGSKRALIQKDEIMDWKTLFLAVEGRMGKKDFWVGFAILFVIGLIMSRIKPLSGIWSLASIYFCVCVGGKRLHDIGKSAWLVLVPTGIIVAAYVVGAVIGGAAFLGLAATGNDSAAVVGGLAGLGLLGVLGFLGFLVAIAAVIWLGTRDGDVADNQFGPPREVPLVTAF
jgi:uncharacterized membrane protein YhaH (DUF805 family)